jgi:molybdate transport repressor ModE-like protein
MPLRSPGPEQLRLLHLIAQNGTLAGAARELGVSPAAITQQVARIERALGADVLVRHSRGVTMTALGELLAVEGEQIARSVARAREAAADQLRHSSRRLRLGTLASTVRPFVADALAFVRRRRPDAELTVVETGSEEGALGVAAGDLDVAVVADYGELSAHEGTRLHRLTVDEMRVVVPADHPLLDDGDQPVNLQTLVDEDWVSGAPGRQHRIQQDRIAAQYGLTPRVVFQTESYEVAQAMVAARLVVALVPSAACSNLEATVALPILGSPSRELLAITREDVSPLVTQTVRALRETSRSTD